MPTTITTSASSASAAAFVEEEEEERVCRICRMGEDESSETLLGVEQVGTESATATQNDLLNKCLPCDDEGVEGSDRRHPRASSSTNALFHPCRCSGSIKYVHEECLIQWLRHSKRKKCEVCGTEYTFRKIYSEDAPKVLGMSEFILGLVQRLWRMSRSALRLLLVAFVWLAVVPLVTSWVWRLCFARATQQTVVSILRRACAFNLLLTDCVYGSFLSAAIVFVFLGTASLREYLRQIRYTNHHQVPNARDLHVHHNHHRGHFHLHDNLLEELENEQQHQQEGEENLGRGAVGVGGQLHGDGPQPMREAELEQLRAEDYLAEAFHRQERQDEEGRREIIHHRPHNNNEVGEEVQPLLHQPQPQPQPVPPPPQPQQQQQHNMGGLDLDRIEDVPFEELIGMQGPLLSLFENATTILLSNLFFLFVSVMLPFNIGRLCLSIFGHLNINIMQSMEKDTNSMHSQMLHLSLEAMGNLKDGISSEIADMRLSTADSGRSVNKLVRAATDFEAQLEPPNWKDLLTLGTGYLATLGLGATIGFVIIFFRCLRAYTRMEESRSLSLRELFAIVPIMAKRAYSYLAYSCVVLKVAFLLIVELGIFPLFFGLWLDLCSLPLFDAMLQTRMQFGLKAPITFTLIHWTLGIIYMFLVSVSVSVLREILKPGVLAFLRDPADPNINPFRELFEDSFSRHVRKIVLGSLIYGSVAMVIVYMPVQFVKSIFPESFPIVIKLLDPLSELPIHLLMLHFGLPLTFEYLRPRRVMRFVIHSWLRYASKLLNVDTHILQSGSGDQDGGEGEETEYEGERDGHATGIDTQAASTSTPPVRSTSNGQRKRISDVRSLLARGISVYKESWELFVQSDLTLNLRLALLVICSCAAVQLSNTVILSLPLFLGRQLCRLIGFPVHHDVYNILMGVYILWASSFFLRKMYLFLSTTTFHMFLTIALQYSVLVSKYCVLGAIWLIVIPSILGTLVHLTFVVPWTVPLNHTPIFFIYQDWAIGLVSLKVFHKVITSIPFVSGSPEAVHIPALVFKWKEVFNRLQLEGIRRVSFKWALVEVTLPVLMSLTAQLCLPYTFVHSVLPSLGLSLYFRQFVYRYGYTLLAAVLQLNQWKSYVKSYFWKLHNTIRDDKYLVSKQICNME